MHAIYCLSIHSMLLCLDWRTHQLLFPFCNHAAYNARASSWHSWADTAFLSAWIRMQLRDKKWRDYNLRLRALVGFASVQRKVYENGLSIQKCWSSLLIKKITQGEDRAYCCSVSGKWTHHGDLWEQKKDAQVLRRGATWGWAQWKKTSTGTGSMSGEFNVTYKQASRYVIQFSPCFVTETQQSWLDGRYHTWRELACQSTSRVSPSEIESIQWLIPRRSAGSNWLLILQV